MPNAIGLKSKENLKKSNEHRIVRINFHDYVKQKMRSIRREKNFSLNSSRFNKRDTPIKQL